MKKNEAIDEARIAKGKGNDEPRHIERAEWYLKSCLLYEKAYTELKAQRVKDRDAVVKVVNSIHMRNDEKIELINKIYKGVE